VQQDFDGHDVMRLVVLLTMRTPPFDHTPVVW
jgi:hypothetical protein